MTEPAEPAVPPPGWPAQHPAGDWSAPGWAPPRRNAAGVLSLVAGVLALPMVLFVFPGLVLGAAALALGLVTRARVRRGEATVGGMATTGVVLGSLAVALSLTWGATIFFVGRRHQHQYDACVTRTGDRDACAETYDPPTP